MDIRHRSVDIKTLQVKILQSFLELAIQAEYSNDSWKHDLYCAIESGAHSKAKASFIETYDLILQIGETNYSIADLDASVIFAILSYSNNKNAILKLHIPNEIRNKLDCLRIDRNSISHTNGCESEEDIFHWALATLENMRKFISTVWKQDNLNSEASRIEFERLFSSQINKLEKALEMDYDEYKQFLYDLDSYDVCLDDLFRSVQLMKSIEDRLEKDSRFEEPFISAAKQKVKISKSCYWGSKLGEYFFNKGDYPNAVYYYEIVAFTPRLGLLKKNDYANLASMYINGIGNKLSPKEGRELLKKKKPSNASIEEYQCGDYTFYRYKEREL